MANWYRIRFLQPTEDYRPIKFPPPGPFWCSGYACDELGETPILIAYVKDPAQILEFWPEALFPEEQTFTQECEKVEFSDRFSKPDWWKE